MLVAVQFYEAPIELLLVPMDKRAIKYAENCHSIVYVFNYVKKAMWSAVNH